MKIYCINNQDGYCKLTLGGSYNTQENKGDYYYIYDDNGEMKKYLLNNIRIVWISLKK